MSDESTGGYTANPRETKYILTEDSSVVARFMEGSELLGTGIQIRRVAKPQGDDPTVFREWWEVIIFDDPHLVQSRNPQAG
ncbi:hypothetical protein PV721_20595 [Streptomyces sp. MB09-01]|uniref:hypothetical protein n=1 Tax=unclassified Streptomyces TaxID=2593676 RepID=UPI0029B82301|nr:hypothetical protein [Streptomyces sp. MB09-01]MDX3536733.1 hypothetical protein [Streptomyces sp. MB09-01]